MIRRSDENITYKRINFQFVTFVSIDRFRLFSPLIFKDNKERRGGGRRRKGLKFRGPSAMLDEQTRDSDGIYDNIAEAI